MRSCHSVYHSLLTNPNCCFFFLIYGTSPSFNCLLKISSIRETFWLCRQLCKINLRTNVNIFKEQGHFSVNVNLLRHLFDIKSTWTRDLPHWRKHCWLRVGHICSACLDKLTFLMRCLAWFIWKPIINSFRVV